MITEVKDEVKTAVATAMVKRAYAPPTAVASHAPTPVPQADRVLWLSSAWEQLRAQFNLMTLPPKVLITCGWPSRRARGRAATRNPSEIVVGEWKDNDTEAAIVSIHPERFRSPSEVLLSLLYVMMKRSQGRAGTLELGLLHDKVTGEVTIMDNDDGARTLHRLDDLRRKLGDLPVGFAEIAEPKPRPPAQTRLRKWTCPACDAILRIASDTLGSEFVHTIHRPRVALVLAKAEGKDSPPPPVPPPPMPGPAPPRRAHARVAHA
jgi:hypothetical protein